MEKKQEPESKLVLPSRPPLPSAPRGQRVTLVTNSFRLSLNTSNQVFVYDVKFTEDIPANDTPMRKYVIRGLRADLEKQLSPYIFTGTVLYSPKDIGPTPLLCSFAEKDTRHQVIFQRTSSICVQDITGHKDSARSLTAHNFLNLVVKSLLSACNMFPVGRTKRYLLPSALKKVPDYPLEVWPGYYTSVNFCEAGLLLEVDYSARILRQESVYDLIRSTRTSRAEDYMDALREELVGHSVLVRYGNKQTYVVADVDFSLTPLTCEFETPEGRLSVDAYFKQKYLINIVDKKQPLLMSVKHQRGGKDLKVYLVPELCSLTGLPKEMKEDRATLKQVSIYTKLQPDQRVREAEKLLKSFANAEARGKEAAPRKIMADWNLRLDMAPYEVEGLVLPAQEIGLSEGRTIKVGESGLFFFKENVTAPLPLDKWILVHTEKDKPIAENFVDVMYTAAKTFGIAVGYPAYAESKGIKAKDFIGTLQQTMEKYHNPQIVVAILPPPSYNEYAQLKKFATTQSPPILTQMVKTRTLSNQKNMMAVCSKIVLQINAKRNGELWRIRAPPAVPKKTMLVGIDQSKEGRYRCLGFASSFDPYFTHYYTQVQKLEDKEWVDGLVGALLLKALEKFLKETKTFLPQLIVVYRDGLTESQRSTHFVGEVKSMLKAVADRYPDYTPKFVYATVSKKIHTRFFLRGDAPRSSGTLANPRPGTVVHSGIVDPRKYEFLIMPQHVSEGTGTPARIHVLYDTSGLPCDVFEELTNAACYGYFNWQGAIRTPAPCKYAFGHSRLVAKYTKTCPAEQLLSFLHFL